MPPEQKADVPQAKPVNAAQESEPIGGLGKRGKKVTSDTANPISIIRENGGVRLTENKGEFKDLHQEYPGLINKNGRGEDEIISALQSEGYDVPNEPGALAEFLRGRKRDDGLRDTAKAEQSTQSKWERLGRGGTESVF